MAPAASSGGKQAGAFVPQSLLDQANENPNASFDVIVQGDGSEKAGKLADRLARGLAKDQGLSGPDARAFAVRAADQFDTISGFKVTLDGKDVLRLAKKSGSLSITPDAGVTLQATNNNQILDDSVAASWYWTSNAFKTATPVTIAVVDSGVDATRGARSETGSSASSTSAAAILDERRCERRPRDRLTHSTTGIG